MLMILRTALLNLRRHAKRTLLTGSLLLVAALVLVATDAIGAAVRQNLTDTTIFTIAGHLQVRHRDAAADPLRPEVGQVPTLPAGAADIARLEAVPGVAAVAPRLRYGGALVVGDRQFEALVVGVRSDAERAATPRLRVGQGRFLAGGDGEGIVISAKAAGDLAVGVGDAVTLFAARPDGLPVAATLRVTGIVDTGAAGLFVDHISYVDLPRLQGLLGIDGVSEFKLLLADGQDVGAAARALAATLPAGQVVRTYKDLGGVVLGIAAVSDMMFELVFVILSVIAIAGVLNTMLMAVSERRREIGVLSAIGARPGRILALFLTEAGILALGFALVGVAVAAGATAVLARTGITVGDAVPLIGAERLYPVLDARLLFQVPLRLALVALIGAAYPAFAASRLDPAACLRQ
jgi:putative ABC transport system permease protein